MNPAHNLFVRKLNKKLYDYKKKMIKYKKAFMFVKNINKNERNETHCDSKHFKIIRKISDIDNLLNSSNKKSISIIPKTMTEHWKLMLDEFDVRINLIDVVVESLQIAINNNNYTELKTYALEKVAWSDKLPNSIKLYNDFNGNIVKIKIGVENFMMIYNGNLCNCYIVAKSRNSDKLWNLYGEYDKEMYCFSPNSLQHKFAELEPPEKKKNMKEIINDLNNLILK